MSVICLNHCACCVPFSYAHLVLIAQFFSPDFHILLFFNIKIPFQFGCIEKKIIRNKFIILYIVWCRTSMRIHTIIVKHQKLTKSRKNRKHIQTRLHNKRKLIDEQRIFASVFSFSIQKLIEIALQRYRTIFWSCTCCVWIQSSYNPENMRLIAVVLHGVTVFMKNRLWIVKSMSWKWNKSQFIQCVRSQCRNTIRCECCIKICFPEKLYFS